MKMIFRSLMENMISTYHRTTILETRYCLFGGCYTNNDIWFCVRYFGLRWFDEELFVSGYGLEKV